MGGLSFDDIVRDYYPDRQVEDIRACIRYAMDIIVAADLGASRAADEELLSIAQEHKRLFMTRDGDFGSLVSVRELGAGLSICGFCPQPSMPSTQNSHASCSPNSEEDLHKAFVVVEPRRHRFRRISQ
jgi:hypothetical protein